MSHQIRGPAADAESSAGAFQDREKLQPAVGPQGVHLALGEDPTVLSDAQVIGELSRVVEAVNLDPTFLKLSGECEGIVLVLSATDTGRELAIELTRLGARAEPYEGGRCSVRIKATEKVLWEILSGGMDADAAFFAGKVRVSGSITDALRVKNRLLPLIQANLARTANGGSGSGRVTC